MKQEIDLKALNNMTLNSNELEQKESTLDLYIPRDNAKISMQQVNVIQSAAERSGIDIKNIQRISEEWKQDQVDKK